ncbi:unnamed protein product [Eruca vesicaria subsp. sativa]|uniref:Uncharacterized protein n=1 Tax=Eruca vesicaria subsp. sativa TaxID=29727 RepID=A0ABC8J495_ERUVS|nr:unnamed protein product [Eruca vesicaria subsp. sativa]
MESGSKNPFRKWKALDRQGDSDAALLPIQTNQARSSNVRMPNSDARARFATASSFQRCHGRKNIIPQVALFDLLKKFDEHHNEIILFAYGSVGGFPTMTGGSKMTNLLLYNLERNHKSWQITQVYGFYNDCLRKYGNALPLETDVSLLLSNTNSLLQVGVFDCLANLLHDDSVVNGVQPKLKLATSVNPKLLGGMLTLLNVAYPKECGMLLLPLPTVAELNAYVLNSGPQGELTILKLQMDSAPPHSRNGLKSFSMYRVQTSDSDSSESAVFVAFDVK